MLWKRVIKDFLCALVISKKSGGIVSLQTSMLRLSDSGAGEAQVAWAVGTSDDKHTTNFYLKDSLVVSA